MTSKKSINILNFTFHQLPVKGNFVLVKCYAHELNGKLGIVVRVNGGYFSIALIEDQSRILELYETEMTIVNKYLWFRNEKEN